MRIGELKEIIKNVDDDEEILITMPELKYIHHVKEIKINPLNTEDEIEKYELASIIAIRPCWIVYGK